MLKLTLGLFITPRKTTQPFFQRRTSKRLMETNYLQMFPRTLKWLHFSLRGFNRLLIRESGSLGLKNRCTLKELCNNNQMGKVLVCPLKAFLKIILELIQSSLSCVCEWVCTDATLELVKQLFLSPEGRGSGPGCFQVLNFGDLCFFQAVCPGKGDRRDGSETDRTLLWSGAIQRAEGLQVKHAQACVSVPLIRTEHRHQFMSLFLIIKRGKLISTILDWEDALPDRDLNRADDASR